MKSDLNYNEEKLKDNKQGEKLDHNCDRRLSRAARSILVNKTLSILQHHDEKIDSLLPLTGLSETDKLDLYESSMLRLISHSQTCLLNPKRDMYWQEERRRTTYKPRRRSRDKKLHVCGLCGKKFVSKYYLDIHVETTHQVENVSKDNIHMHNELIICPGNEICTYLGGSSKVCEKKALENEPFYGSGLHDTKNYYSQSLKRKYQIHIHSKPCKEKELQSSRHGCHEMIETCFGDNFSLIHDMSSLLCDTQTCHGQLYDLMESVVSIHHGRGEWNSHHEEIGSFGLGFVTFCILLLFYYWNTLRKWMSKIYKKRRSQKKIFDMGNPKKLD